MCQKRGKSIANMETEYMCINKYIFGFKLIVSSPNKL